VDRKAKKELYQHTFRTPEYFWFDRNTLEWQGFSLIEGQYQPITPNENGYLWSKQLGLYLGIFANKLRYFTESGELVPTPQRVCPTGKISQRTGKISQRTGKISQRKRTTTGRKISPKAVRIGD
jgi:hypothetical protein